MDEALAYLSPITSQVQGMIDVVGSHPHFALIAVFLLALSEAVPVVGTVVPGSTAILGISALATTAQLDPWLLLIAATLGAIAGDGFSFWLGMRYHAGGLRRARSRERAAAPIRPSRLLAVGERSRHPTDGIQPRRSVPSGSFQWLRQARGRSGLLLLAFVHEALLRRAPERLAVRADRL